MHFLRCVLAEWALVRPRLLRTRLGPWLIALGAGLVWLGHHGVDPVSVALYAGAFGAVLGAAFGAGADADRAALVVTLTHPSTPLAVAAGRWLAAVLPAAGLTLACVVAVGGEPAAALPGVATAAAVAGCALPAVLALGTGAALALSACLAVAGAAPPEHLVGLADPGLARLAAASALELGPALWRYREVQTGAVAALLHAAAWAALGVVLASGLVARRIRRR
ncbi:MAG TPA: hypothetical protein VGQ25_05620 [Gemmatimonadales bacterium]|nr:hypothetical protein [Gemmatimonadales bacterium]